MRTFFVITLLAACDGGERSNLGNGGGANSEAAGGGTGAGN